MSRLHSFPVLNCIFLLAISCELLHSGQTVLCMCHSVHSLSAANEASKLQLRKLQTDLAAETEKHRQTAETVKRLSRKYLLASKVLSHLLASVSLSILLAAVITTSILWFYFVYDCSLMNSLYHRICKRYMTDS